AWPGSQLSSGWDPSRHLTAGGGSAAGGRRVLSLGCFVRLLLQDRHSLNDDGLLRVALGLFLLPLTFFLEYLTGHVQPLYNFHERGVGIRQKRWLGQADEEAAGGGVGDVDVGHHTAGPDDAFLALDRGFGGRLVLDPVADGAGAGHAFTRGAAAL